ncbi:MAG: YdcF family protein [Leptolyngbya sp. Prado105]|nr:YdcF family protein [Leptolyngbya sp. Prado105]
MSWIPVKLMIAFHQAPSPQAILILGGDFARTRFAAKFWQSRKNLDVWVSDFPENLKQQSLILTEEGVPMTQLWLDGQAKDTVTNFTTLVEQLTQAHLQHLYLITSDYHMRRASAIAAIVLGSEGIGVTPVPVSSHIEQESVWRVLRDCGRSIIWLITKRTGASLNPRTQRRISNH